MLWAAHVVDRVARGGRWHCVDGCGASGDVEDPSASPLAVAAVLDGRRLYPRRADLQAVVAGDRARSAELADTFDSRRPRGGRTPDGSGGLCPPRCGERHGRGLPGRERPNARRRRAGGVGLRAGDVAVRDVLYALAVGRTRARPSRCGRYWRAHCRALAGRGVGVAGFQRLRPRRRAACRDLAGGGAGLRARPSNGGHAGHRLAVGPRPEHIRELAPPATDWRTLGVRLPPRRPFGRRAG